MCMNIRSSSSTSARNQQRNWIRGTRNGIRWTHGKWKWYQYVRGKRRRDWCHKGDINVIQGNVKPVFVVLFTCCKRITTINLRYNNIYVKPTMISKFLYWSEFWPINTMLIVFVRTRQQYRYSVLLNILINQILLFLLFYYH